MGQPKALLRLAPVAPTLLETVVAAVGQVGDEVMLVGEPDWPMPPSLEQLRQVPDGGHGATDGVIAALRSTSATSCIIVGCDMPFLHPPLLRELAERAAETGRGVLPIDATGPHPLHAVWRPADLPRITASVTGGERSLAALARSLAMVEVDLADRDEATRWSVFNANTPEDVALARSHAETVAARPDERSPDG